MFAGHFLAAFVLATSVAAWRGWPDERALAVGAMAGAFAMLPDIDMLYAVAGLVGSLEGVFITSDAFWDVANEIHRGATHSLVVGLVASTGFAAWCARDGNDPRIGTLGELILGSLVGVVTLVSGIAPGAVVAAFVLGGVGLVTLGERVGLGPRAVLATGGLGLLSHPFGDVFAGPSPALLYPLPFNAGLLNGQVLLHPDPTLHLLGAFFIEIATIWAGLLIVARLQGWRLSRHINRRAALGVAYAGAVFVIPVPTIEVASPFVFSVLAVGFIGTPVRSDRRQDRSTQVVDAVTTALSAVTLAAAAYAVTYLVFLS
ncbi:metal-dependent hydrolase (plasmid) [Halobaculum sp. CBA1158]|uniref:metal-dependent hydrolase n=1 Tax=Halobaculum sp. CBA1158 TaxID=2904243 RepID=UPI001F3189DD|nr:metal-dependent hydrolase [Halobaculum sp. CBA1158]UIP01610.1 metal-dependent hydrolase [Halobaculum sp. CBA1158]